MVIKYLFFKQKIVYLQKSSLIRLNTINLRRVGRVDDCGGLDAKSKIRVHQGKPWM